MKKDKLPIVGLWLLVTYAVALLAYVTLLCVFKKGDVYISSFGSILSAFATLAASFVAVYLYSSWEEQKTYDLKKGYVERLAENIFTIDAHLNFAIISINSLLEKEKQERISLININPFEEHTIYKTLLDCTYIANFLKEILKDDSFDSIQFDHNKNISHLVFVIKHIIQLSSSMHDSKTDKQDFYIFDISIYQANEATESAFNSMIKFLNKHDVETLLKAYKTSFETYTSLLAQKIKPEKS